MLHKLFAEIDESFTLVNAKLPINLNFHSDNSELLPEFSEIAEKSIAVILRDLKRELGKDQFRQLLYACLTGVQVLVRGPKIQRLESLYGLSSLVPRACRRVKAQASEYTDPDTCNFIGIALFMFYKFLICIEKYLVTKLVYHCHNFRRRHLGGDSHALCECMQARYNTQRAQDRKREVPHSQVDRHVTGETSDLTDEDRKIA